MKKITVMLIMSAIILSGCSTAAPVNEHSEADGPVVEFAEDKEADAGESPADGEAADESFEPADGPVEINITTDDRSIKVSDNGPNGEFVKFYYEEALLPDSVKNHEKINADIEAKKDAFFKEHEDWDGCDFDELLEVTSPDYIFCYAAVRSVYLDERYYSVNMERYACYGGTDVSEFIGCTYDLETGEEAALKDVLGVNDDELAAVLHDRLNLYEKEPGEVFPTTEEFLANEGWGSYKYCITQDGKIYALYDKYVISAGYRGSSAFYITDHNEGDVRYSEVRDLDGGVWYTLSLSEESDLATAMNIELEEGRYLRQKAPVLKDGKWYVPVAFTEFEPALFDDVYIATAEVEVNDPSNMKDTSDSMFDDLYGEWYSSSTFVTDDNRAAPMTCCVFSKEGLDVYEFSPDDNCYMFSGTKDIHSLKRISRGFAVEAGYSDGEGKVTYITSEADPYLLESFWCWQSESTDEELHSQYSGSSSLTSPKADKSDTGGVMGDDYAEFEKRGK